LPTTEGSDGTNGPADTSPEQHWSAKVLARLLAPVDIASLAVFRVCFGLALAWDVWGFLRLGLVNLYWVDPLFHFTFLGFDWVQPWQGLGMYVHFLVLLLLALCIAAGLFYRLATILFFPAFAYVLLLDKAYYLNHFYLITLISFLLIFVPAHRCFSLDALRNTKLRSDTTPAWTVWVLSGQLAIVYFFGGVAKLRWDWLVLGEPMRTFLVAASPPPGMGPLLTSEAAVYFFAWGGALFDLAIPFLLWMPRTRAVAYTTVVGFNLCNAFFFEIGIFPWFMICASTLFFRPDWPRRIGWVWMLPPRTDRRQRTATTDSSGFASMGFGRRAVLMVMTVYFVIQLTLPFSQYFYPGNVLWRHEPAYFIWHMKLATSATETHIVAKDPSTGEEYDVDPRIHLNAKQIRKFRTNPDMLLQYAHFLARQAQDNGIPNLEVRAQVRSSLNRRPPRMFVYPDVNLAEVERSMSPVAFLYPLETAPLAEKPLRKAAELSETENTDTADP